MHGNVTMLTIIFIILAMKSFKPLKMAISITILSLIIAMTMFKESKSAWFPFLMILAFSSGMMTLFIHASSLTPQQNTSKQTKFTPILMMMTLIMINTPTNLSPSKTSMKIFSSQTITILLTAILVITMLAISTHAHNPNQAVNSTF